MKLGIVVNVMDSGEAGATTYRLAADAINLGHEVWIVSTGNLSYNADDSIGAFAVLEALDRKVNYMRYHRRNFSNVEIATL